MPATIRVETGISAGTNYWIDRPVLRIGSDPQCEICLPTADLSPHALTLEFRDGSYRAYNRGTTPVTVGAAAVQPGANGIWHGDQTVQLPGDLRLVLEIDGDPRPSPRPDAQLDDLYVTENGSATVDAIASTGESTAKQSSKTLVQLGIIGFCLLATAAFLTMPRGSETAAPERPTFEALVETSLTNDEASRGLLRRLQYAQAALVRDHQELALARFSKLRDQLVRQHDAATAEERENAQRMLDYVEFRLGELPR